MSDILSGFFFGLLILENIIIFLVFREDDIDEAIQKTRKAWRKFKHETDE